MLSELDGLVEKALAEWKVPGLALAVVKDDELLLSRGYGVRDIAADARVTPRSKFLLCSITKSFTAAGLGLLVEEGKLDWGSAVRDYIPEYRLRDAAATEQMTVRDLLTHVSGLPRHDWIHMPGDLSMPRILDAMRHLEPCRDLRAGFEYSNLGYLVAGHIAERITGLSWEEFTRERLLLPLGFTNFSFSIAGLSAAPDHARPHIIENDVVRHADWTAINALPAGGLYASVSDLAKWMRCLLHGGTVDGKTVLPTRVVRQMATPLVYVGPSMSDEGGHVHYGMGLQTEHYRGEPVVYHTGSWLGWATLMTMLPQRRIGVAVLTNHSATFIRDVLARSAFDALCGHEPIDWYERFRAKRHQILAQRKADEVARQTLRRLGTSPSHALDDYVGDYEHPAYGRISIAKDREALIWSWRGMDGPLSHYHYDVFTVPYKLAELNPDGLALMFGHDSEGAIDKLAASLEPMVPDIIFRRRVSRNKPANHE